MKFFRGFSCFSWLKKISLCLRLYDRHWLDSFGGHERGDEGIMEAEAVMKVLPAVVFTGSKQLNFGQIKDDIAEIIGSVDVPCCEDIDGHATIFPQQELFHAVEQLQSGDMPIVRIFPFCHDFPGNQLDGLADKMVCFDRISGVFFQDLCQQVLF